MSQRNYILYASLAALLIAGAIGTHRYRRGQELGQQRLEKAAGLVPVTLVGVEAHAFRNSVPFTGTLLAVNRAELKWQGPIARGLSLGGRRPTPGPPAPLEKALVPAARPGAVLARERSVRFHSGGATRPCTFPHPRTHAGKRS